MQKTSILVVLAIVALSAIAEAAPGGHVKDMFQQEAHANLFNNGRHNLGAKVFAMQNNLANGFEFQHNGAGLHYYHINGHGAILTHSKFPGIEQQLGEEGPAHLWSSMFRAIRQGLTDFVNKLTTGLSDVKIILKPGLGQPHRLI